MDPTETDPEPSLFGSPGLYNSQERNPRSDRADQPIGPRHQDSVFRPCTPGPTSRSTTDATRADRQETETDMHDIGFPGPGVQPIGSGSLLGAQGDRRLNSDSVENLLEAANSDGLVI